MPAIVHFCEDKLEYIIPCRSTVEKSPLGNFT